MRNLYHSNAYNKFLILYFQNYNNKMTYTSVLNSLKFPNKTSCY